MSPWSAAALGFVAGVVCYGLVGWTVLRSRWGWRAAEANRRIALLAAAERTMERVRAEAEAEKRP